MSRAAASQISFADWELMRQGLVLEPLLQAISDFLDDHKELVAKVRDDLRRGLKKPDTGRRRGQQTAKYRDLIAITEEVVACARSALAAPRRTRGSDLFCDLAITGLYHEIAHYCRLADRVVDQARRCAIDGEQVPNSDKILSIFEPHTELIKRGKVRTPVEFGHKVLLAESVRGLITQYQVLEGNPPDAQHVGRSLQRHKRAFGCVPELYAADRGFFSEPNLTLYEHGGVKRVCIPQSGGKRAPQREAREQAPDFNQGQRFRAGVEGRISGLFRGRAMKRCLAQGIERFELLVGAAVLANNLMRIASLQVERSLRYRRAA